MRVSLSFLFCRFSLNLKTASQRKYHPCLLVLTLGEDLLLLYPHPSVASSSTSEASDQPLDPIVSASFFQLFFPLLYK